MKQKSMILGHKLPFFLFLCTLSFVFLAFYSYYTSPFTACDNGGDSAFFCLVGRGMTKGYLPYRDFFDMKGPFLFFIEYIGQLICYGRWGIFLIQTVNLTITLVLICRTFELYGIERKLLQIALLLPVLCIVSITFEGGNLTEEFSLVPLLSCMYLCLYYLKNRENPDEKLRQRILCGSAAWYGFSFGLLLMIRVTNAALICAMIFVVLVNLVVDKQAKKIFLCAALFLSGLFLSLLPAVVYYATKGILGQMLEAVFVLGTRYSGAQSASQHFSELLSSDRSHLLLLVLVPCLVGGLLKWQSWRERLLLFAGSAATFLAIASGNNYTHYYTLAIPLVVMMELSIVGSIGSEVSIRPILAFMAAGIMLSSQTGLMQVYFDMAYDRHFNEEAYDVGAPIRDVASRIPEEDRNSVFSYNLDPSWYTYVDLFPCMRCCGWQSRYLAIMPEMYAEMEMGFRVDPPKWLLLPNYIGQLPVFIEEMLDDEYQRHYENDKYVLFALED